MHVQQGNAIQEDSGFQIADGVVLAALTVERVVSNGIRAGRRQALDLLQKASLILLAVACAACAGAGDASADSIVSAAPVDEPQIAFFKETNVCVQVRVAPEIWPNFLAETNSGLSGILATELRRQFDAGGGMTQLSGTVNQPRFANNHNGANPLCDDAEQDIWITADYTARPSGGPFVFSYRIVQGATLIEGSDTRDIQDEQRSGKLRFTNLQEPVQSAIDQDLRARSRTIFDHISWGYEGD